MSVTAGVYLEYSGCSSCISKIDMERAIRNLDRAMRVQDIRECACGTNARLLFGQRLIRWRNDVKVRVKQEVGRLAGAVFYGVCVFLLAKHAIFASMSIMNLLFALYYAGALGPAGRMLIRGALRPPR